MAVFLTAWSGVLQAQVALRGSLTGYEAAAARVGNIASTDYNLLLGPVRVKLAAALDLEGNDNINLADDSGGTKKLSDLIIRPRVSVIGLWQVTRLNRLDLNLGLGLERHLNHPDRDTSTLIIDPSEVNFDLYIRSLKLSFHDKFSLQQDPLSDPTLNNTAGTGFFSNTFGVRALWDLNKVIVTAGYDHTDLLATTKGSEVNNRHSELLYASLGIPLETTTAGLQGSVSTTRYGLGEQPDLTVFSIGPFLQALLTPYTRFDISGGAQFTSFKARNGPSGGFGVVAAHSREEAEGSAPGFNFTATLTNRLNASFSQVLSVGHERELAFGANYVDRNFVNYGLSWRMSENITLSLGAFYEDGTAVGAPGNEERFSRFGLNLSFGYRLTQHLTVALRYSYTQKSSDLDFRDYVQNVLGVTFSYDF